MQAEDEPPPLPRYPDVTPALEALVRAALAKNPDLRPAADQLAPPPRRGASPDPFTPLDA